MFENFSKINYYLNGQTLELTDIFKSININTDNSININSVKNTDGSRPDQLAQKIYNDPKLFWVNFAVNNIKNPFTQWNKSGAALTQQNSADYDTQVFQFGNTGKYLPSSETYFNTDDVDSYAGICLGNIQQNDIIIFETGSGPFELKTYGAGSITSVNGCGYPHFGQTDIPDNFLNRNNIIQISCGKNFTACLDDSGYIWVWGEDIGLENSGFIVNGRLYNSPNGGYKHIDTTNNKIIAINYNDSLECFGTCYDFTFTGESEVVKSAWMSGPTLAGVVIKTDNTVKTLGPIVSTNSTLQYFSEISCADEYCLGVVTGPAFSGYVVGFGSTGYFSQIGQNALYSSELTKLGTVDPTNPIYPFTDQNNKIIKNYEKGVLEIQIKDLQPFTSPTGNSDEGYRANYQKVFGSSDNYKSLIGFTDFDTISREGYILNNPKVFAGAGSDYHQTKIYKYSDFYNKNLKPNRYYNLYKDSDKKYFGITFIEDVNFYPSASPISDSEFVSLPQFKVNYSQQAKNNGSDISYFSSIKNYKNLFGISFINVYGSELVLDAESNNSTNYGLTASIGVLDGIAMQVQIDGDNKIRRISPLLNTVSDDFTESTISHNRFKINIASYSDNPQGISLNYRVDDFSDNLHKIIGNIKSWGKNNSRGLMLLNENGIPFILREPENAFYLTYKDADGSEAKRLSTYWDQILPPPGVTFKKWDHSDTQFWAAGLKNNGEIMICGITSEIEYCFGITYSPYTISGITAEDIFLNADNIVSIKNNGKLAIFGSPFAPSWDVNYGGQTVTNAQKVIGPFLTGDFFLVLTKNNELQFIQPFNDTHPEYNIWHATFGITLAGWDFPDYRKNRSYAELDKLFNPSSLDASYLLQNNYQIRDIDGYYGCPVVTKMDGSKVQLNPFNAYGSQQVWPWLFQGINIWDYLYGFKTENYNFSSGGDFWLEYNFKNRDTDQIEKTSGYLELAFLRSPIYFYPTVSPYNKSFFGGIYQEVDSQTPFTLGIFYDFLLQSIITNTNTNNGIIKTRIPGLRWADDNRWKINPTDNNTVWDILMGGVTYDMNYSTHGVLFSVQYGIQKVPVIVTNSKYTWGYLENGVLSNKANKFLLGNGYLVVLNENDRLTMIIGDKVPYNNVADFSNLTVLNSINIENPEEFYIWENSIIQKMAIGNDRFYGYQPDYIKNTTNYWGSDSNNSLAPVGLTYTHIDCFYNHCCGLNKFGLVECWGDNDTGITSFLTPPSSLGICKNVSVGFDHTCAEDITGKITCWGRDNYGQSTVPAYVNDGTSNKILDCGKYFSSVLKTDGRILIWGRAITGPAQITNFGSSVPTELQIES